MQQIISFFIRYKNFFLYLFLLLISLVFTIQSHSYHRSKFISSANFFSGGVYNTLSTIENYFNLKTRNQELLEENTRLRERLAKESIPGAITIPRDSTYSYNFARVLKNSYAKTDNFLLIKAGTNKGITRDMGVITSKGIVGVIDNTSTNYSTVLSILNSNFQTNAMLKNTNHFGTLIWDGKDPNQVKVIDIQQQAPVAIGDTVVTSGRSAIFPEGINIGTVIKTELDNSQNYYTLSIQLINDMTDIGHVYIIKNNDRDEIIELESQEDNE